MVQLITYMKYYVVKKNAIGGAGVCRTFLEKPFYDASFDGASLFKEYIILFPN